MPPILISHASPIRSAARVFITAIVALAAISAKAQDAEVVHFQGDYRHKHMKQVRGLDSADFSAVLAASDEFVEKNSTDAESFFFKAIASAHLGEFDNAKQSAKQAMKFGLPGSRFFAGPRDWTRPFEERKELAELKAEYGTGLVHGPMLGQVTSDGASFWMRATRPSQVALQVTDSQRKPVVRIASNATDAADHTAVVRANGLRPSTKYFYQAIVNNQPFGEPREFETAGKEGEKTKFSFAFGGGAAYITRNAHMWKSIAARDPDMLLLLGDNVYIDEPELPNYQRYLYSRRQSQLEFRSLCAKTAVYSIWDDHDFGDNDCFGGPEIDKPAWKRPVWRLFKLNWINPGYGGGEQQPGCWYDFVRGDVHFIMLDGRYYRTPKVEEGAPTMLGPVQKQWLLDRLKASTATIKFIASPVPFIGGNNDKWTGFPDEREEIFSFIEQNKIEGVVLLSADRHRSDVLVTRREQGYDLYEFMSSKLTNHHTHKEIDEKDGALFSYNKKCSFGLVEVDTTAADPTVKYQVISIDKESIHEITIRLSQLKSR